MSIESMKLVHFFPMPNEQFPNVPDDFLLMLCTPLGAKIQGLEYVSLWQQLSSKSRENSETGKFLTDYHI